MSGGGTHVVERTQPSPAQATIPPQFQPYAQQVGQAALGFAQDPRANLTQLFNPSPIPFSVPPLSPLQQAGAGLAAQRVFGGIPVPAAEQLAFQGVTGDPMGQFIRGDFGNTPAVQQAVRGVQQQVLPVIQNANARMGLANSPFEAQQEGTAMAQAIAPIYQAGLGLQAQETNQAIQNLQALGLREAERPIQAEKEAQAWGDIQRQVQAQQAAANVQEFERISNLLTSYLNPFGNYNIMTSPGPFTGRTTTTPSGFGLFKTWGPLMLVPILGLLLV